MINIRALNVDSWRPVIVTKNPKTQTKTRETEAQKPNKVQSRRQPAFRIRVTQDMINKHNPQKRINKSPEKRKNNACMYICTCKCVREVRVEEEGDWSWKETWDGRDEWVCVSWKAKTQSEMSRNETAEKLFEREDKCT